ncbi:unnamed protein product [Chrysoparadoxa australica]
MMLHQGVKVSTEVTSTAQMRHERSWLAKEGEEGEKGQGQGHGMELEPMELMELEQAEAELAARVEIMRAANAQEEQEKAANQPAKEKIKAEQGERAAEYAGEDAALLAKLEGQLQERRRERELSRLEREADIDELNAKVVQEGIVEAEDAAALPVAGMKPVNYMELVELPAAVKEAARHIPPEDVLDEMAKEAAEAKAHGVVDVDKYRQFKQKQAEVQLKRVEMMGNCTEEERLVLMGKMAERIQRLGRIYLSKSVVARKLELANLRKAHNAKAILIQRIARGYMGRKRAAHISKIARMNLVMGVTALCVQRIFRGHQGRKKALEQKKDASARALQRVYRGHIGRTAAHHKRAKMAQMLQRAASAVMLQAAWRGRSARVMYMKSRANWFAAREIQRVFRGVLGRKAFKRKQKWLNSQPGPERIKLGVRLIEDTKTSFTKQQQEIDLLHRAQEKAESRVSAIHRELAESQSDLATLERELAKVDDLEHQLAHITHERDLLQRTAKGELDGHARGEGATLFPGDDAGGQQQLSLRAVEDLKAQAYALDMQVQLKRAEREQRKQMLEAEFDHTFAELESKKSQLDRLQEAIADMESTRQRKDRECKRIQQNLMVLLAEQKKELDTIREKGVQLETATATSAAAATATAQRAREHEKRSSAMHQQTEELMKFQFMSMSLSYFSSLNMLKQMRDLNADTTSAAVTGAADAACAAAAAAAAANVPNVKAMAEAGEDVLAGIIEAKEKQLAKTTQEAKEAQIAADNPFPSDIRIWSIDDVSRWLDTLQLGEYKAAFREAKVDGDLLSQLEAEDMMDVLGMEHKLHLKKVLLSREKLLPLNATQMKQKAAVEKEERGEVIRGDVPDLEAVFSQARNGRMKRVEESLNSGFDANTADEKGNTLLLIGAQQVNLNLVELMIKRGADINHQNVNGNTALHYAMTYDTEGRIGEFLIEKGADDSIENKVGLGPYDGLGD